MVGLSPQELEATEAKAKKEESEKETAGRGPLFDKSKKMGDSETSFLMGLLKMFLGNVFPGLFAEEKSNKEDHEKPVPSVAQQAQGQRVSALDPLHEKNSHGADQAQEDGLAALHAVSKRAGQALPRLAEQGVTGGDHVGSTDPQVVAKVREERQAEALHI